MILMFFKHNIWMHVNCMKLALPLRWAQKCKTILLPRLKNILQSRRRVVSTGILARVRGKVPTCYAHNNLKYNLKSKIWPRADFFKVFRCLYPTAALKTLRWTVQIWLHPYTGNFDSYAYMTSDFWAHFQWYVCNFQLCSQRLSNVESFW